MLMNVLKEPIDAVLMLIAQIRLAHTDAHAKADTQESDLVVCRQVILFMYSLYYVF